MSCGFFAESLPAEFVYVTAGEGSVVNFTLSGYQVGEGGALTVLPGSPFSKQTSAFPPDQLAVAGQFLYEADIFGDLLIYQIAENGSLTWFPPAFFTDSSVHVPVSVAAVGRFAYVTNPGATSVFLISSSGQWVFLNTVATGAGSNPFGVGDPFEQFFYLPNESRKSVSAFQIAQDGTLTELVGSPFKAGGDPTSVAVEPFGRFAYVTNRGSNNVSAFKIAHNGALTPVVGSPFPTGMTPTSVAVSRFVYVANKGSNTISVYQIADNGALIPLTKSPFPTGAGPVSMAVGRFLYVVNQNSNTLSVYKIGVNGALTSVAGSPFSTPPHPIAVAIFP